MMAGLLFSRTTKARRQVPIEASLVKRDCLLKNFATASTTIRTQYNPLVEDGSDLEVIDRDNKVSWSTTMGVWPCRPRDFVTHIRRATLDDGSVAIVNSATTHPKVCRATARTSLVFSSRKKGYLRSALILVSSVSVARGCNIIVFVSLSPFFTWNYVCLNHVKTQLLMAFLFLCLCGVGSWSTHSVFTPKARCLLDSVNASGQAPAKGKYVRGEILHGVFHIKAAKHNKKHSEFTMVHHFNPGGNIPPWLINWLAEGKPAAFVKKLEEVAGKWDEQAALTKSMPCKGRGFGEFQQAA